MATEDIGWINTVRFDVSNNYKVNEGTFVPNDPNNAQAQQVEYWDAQPGNDITGYDPYFGWSLAQAQANKDREIGEYSDQLIDEANANPYQGKITTPAKNKTKVNTRVNHASNGKPKSGLDSDRDDTLADHTDNVLDADDNARDITEGMSDVTAIMALDVATMVNWPLWFPPV